MIHASDADRWQEIGNSRNQKDVKRKWKGKRKSCGEVTSTGVKGQGNGIYAKAPRKSKFQGECLKCGKTVHRMAESRVEIANAVEEEYEEEVREAAAVGGAWTVGNVHVVGKKMGH